MKIYIATHKKVEFPQNEIYLPIQVGAEINSDIGVELKDNMGENISNKNKSFCELTLLYWMWKNCEEDIIGLVHYRRYFFDTMFKNKKEDILKEDKINSLLKKYTLIVPKKRYLGRRTVYKQYEELHNIKDLEECKKIIEEKYPDYVPSFDKVMSNKYLHPYNMFIGKTEILNNYFKWLFDVLFELEKRIDIKNYDKYNSRVYGFLSERLFNVWIEKNIDKKLLKEVYVNNIEENVYKQNIENIKYKIISKIKKKRM